MKTYLLLLLVVFCSFKAQVISSVYFQNNSDELNSSSKQKLDSLAQLQNKLTFRIYGNTDPSGSSAHNQTLSNKRAKKVSEYIKVKAGNNIKLGSSIGLGEGKQLNDNSSEELRAKNRRVDILIEKTLDESVRIKKQPKRNFFTTPISEMKPKDTLLLPEVNFIGGRHVWLPQAEPKIEQLLRILKDNPKITVELQGHICCEYDNFDGEDLDLKTHNLSVTRAQSIQRHLVKNGINKNRIKAKGLGHLDPLVFPEATEEDRSMNRRVEIMIIKK